MQDAQRLDRILADISLCERLDDSDIRSIVNRLSGHCSDNVAKSLGNCIAWLGDDIGEVSMEPEISGIEVTHLRIEKAEEAGQLERDVPRVPYWMKGIAA